MSSMTNRLGQQAMAVKKDLQEMGETVKDAAQEKIEQVGEKASEYYEQGRGKVSNVGCACQDFLRERPISSALIAVGIGWVVGRFWKRS